MLRPLNERMQAALARAIDARDAEALVDLLERASGLPGPRANLDLARDVGVAIAARGGRADALLRAMLASRVEFVVVVAALSLAYRWVGGLDVRGASEALQQLAEDERRHVRSAVVESLRVLIAAKGDALVAELSTWTDGYLQAHHVLEALAERTLLSALRSPEHVLARLEEAFLLADVSPRAAERSHGLRTLRRSMPAQVASIAGRWPETVEWLARHASAKRPETRQVVAEAIAALRGASVRGAEVDRLAAALRGTAPPPRDPTRIVQGTRNRSRGKKGLRG